MRIPGNAAAESQRVGADFLLSNAKKWNTLIRLNYTAGMSGAKAAGRLIRKFYQVHKEYLIYI